ncbi:plasmid mobilization relaxosome protein MobC [Butyrivibrio sp. XB500-5]|uniref:plasmid mobilization protein n=1 Tax=Butyrivibrio sp. XB500-5 TaxID=2364880 RepID=UPI000EA9E002|nr:plasmid mobilization relaxosome protein MobC [Butyrivibrio sp. XB500-5]RKM63024.1 plasmid mobilization relaxosome protein MobC [Butyrivibrio sp. XB500-5]
MQNRTNKISVRLSDDELTRMKAKMEEAGITNMSKYMRKMLLDGYCVRVDTTDIKEMVYLIRMCSNNLNQYARKANGLGVIHEADIKDLQHRFEDIWEGMRTILKKFAAIR